MEHRETLFKFKQKFQPCWQSRYLVTNTTLALPKIALAVLRLRNYSGGGVARLLHGPDKQCRIKAKSRNLSSRELLISQYESFHIFLSYKSNEKRLL